MTRVNFLCVCISVPLFSTQTNVLPISSLFQKKKMLLYSEFWNTMLSSLTSFFSIIFSSIQQIFVKCLLTIMGFLLLSTLLCVVWVKIPYQRCPTVEWVAQRALAGFLIDREWRVHSILPLHSKTLAGETVTNMSRPKWN